MKTSNAVITIIIVIIVLIIGGILYYSNSAPSSSVNNTTLNGTVVSPNGNNPTPSSSNPNTPTQAPTVTTKSATEISKSTAVLNGSVNPNGAETSYWYEYGTSNSLGTSSSKVTLGAGNTSYSAPQVIKGLKANTTYYFRLDAENPNGQANGDIQTFTTTNSNPITYYLPSVKTVSATTINQNSATLKATVDPKGSTTYYWFEYGSGQNLNNTTATNSVPAGSSNGSVSADITNLQPNTTYSYRIMAQNSYGTVSGSVLTFSTKNAAGPTTNQ